MVCLTSNEFRDRLRHVGTIKPSPVVLVSDRPTGPLVSLDDYRHEMADRRVESIGKPGIYLDQSETGAGKTHADIAAFRLAGRSLSIQPTHKNCEEVVTALRAQGLDAVAYPARKTSGKTPNCWNVDADAAERMGLSPAAAVCPLCRDKKRCAESGYLAFLKEAERARISVATHARAIHAGLPGLAQGRDFISVHEDAVDVLVPKLDIGAERLFLARDIVGRMLDEPRYLDWFGDSMGVDIEGNTVADVEKQKRRTKLHEFVTHFANVIDYLIQVATEADAIQGIELPSTMPAPPGTESLLFRVSRDLKADFGTKPIWSFLLYTATGEFHREGVVSNEQRYQSGDGNTLAAGRKNDLHDPAESAALEGDCLVI